MASSCSCSCALRYSRVYVCVASQFCKVQPGCTFDETIAEHRFHPAGVEGGAQGVLTTKFSGERRGATCSRRD